MDEDADLKPQITVALLPFKKLKPSLRWSPGIRYSSLVKRHLHQHTLFPGVDPRLPCNWHVILACRTSQTDIRFAEIKLKPRGNFAVGASDCVLVEKLRIIILAESLVQQLQHRLPCLP